MFLLNRAGSLGKVALFLTAGASLYAQEVTGTLTGSVKDAQNRPLANATIMISAPQLMQPRRATSDDAGHFRVPLLPPGDYTLAVAKDNYLGQTAHNVRLGVGATIRQDFTLKAIQAKAEAVVEVIAATATMDKSDTKTASYLSSEQLLSLPTTGGDRSFTGATDLAPGALISPGGGTGIRGGKTQETGFTLNGTSVGDIYEGRIASQVLIDDAVEDTQVIQSPLHARFGRTGGGIVNVVTKSGGNDFAGSIRYYLSRNDWEAVTPYYYETNGGNSNTYQKRQFDIFLSGPVVKDRLWFSISSTQQPSQQHLYVIQQGSNPANWYPYPYGILTTNTADPYYNVLPSPYLYDLHTTVPSDESSDFTQGKLTFAITGDHVLDATYNESTSLLTHRNPYGYGNLGVSTVQGHSYSQIQQDKYWSFGYRGTFTAKTFVEARYTKVDSFAQFPSPPYPYIVNYGAEDDPAGQRPYGLNTSASPDRRNNQSGNLNLKQFVDWHGTHDIDFGFDFFQAIRGTATKIGAFNDRFYVPWITGDDSPDGQAIVAANNIGVDPFGHHVAFAAMNWSAAYAMGLQGSTYGSSPVYQRYFGQDGLTKNSTSSIYLNDAWGINANWNVMLGLRSDHFKVVDTDGSTLISRQGPLSPRVQVRFDPDGTTKHLWTVTAAKYIQDIPVGFTDAFVKKANSAYVRYGYNAVTDNLVHWVDYNNIVNTSNYDLAHPYIFSNASVNAIRQDISNPYVLEFTLGYRRTYTDGSYVSITGVHKTWKNDFAIYQEADPSFYVTVPDPSGSGLPSKIGFATKYGNSDLLERNYNGVELDWKNTISSTWAFGGNYTWSQLRGNTNGGDNTSQGFRDNTANAPLQYRYTLMAAGISPNNFAPYGNLSNDQTHKARLFGVATLPVGKGKISYSAILRYDSGTPYSEIAVRNLSQYLPPASATVPRTAMATTWGDYSGQEMGAFRRNDTYRVDFKVDYAFPVWGKVQLMGDLQINNMFNTMIMWQPSATGAGNTLANNAPFRVANPAVFGTDAQNASNYQQGRNFLASIGLKF